MHQILAITRKDVLQWTRRPLYFISSTLLGVLILLLVGNTIAGANDIPLGLYDPGKVSELNQHLSNARRFIVTRYDDLQKGKYDLAMGRIAVLVAVSEDPLEDAVTVWTEGHNLLVNQQMSMGLFTVLTQPAKELSIPIRSQSLFPVTFSLRDYVTPGLVAYLCYVIACMNIGFAWIYEWMEKTYKQIAMAPNGIYSAIVAKTLTVTLESSVVLWLALCITSPVAKFTLGSNCGGVIGTTMLSMFCFTCLGLSVACFLRTIRIYTMFISICGVALMFASGVIIPVEALPTWEHLFALLLPMYYSADAFRGVMLGTPAYYVRDALVLLGWSLVCLSISFLCLSKRNSVIG